MGNINESKFSTIKIYDNGVAIGMKLSPTTTQNIYISNEDMEKLIKKFTGTIIVQGNVQNSTVNTNDNSYARYIANKSSDHSDGIEDAVY